MAKAAKRRGPVTVADVEALERRANKIYPWQLSREDERELWAIKQGLVTLKFRVRYGGRRKRKAAGLRTR